MATGKWMPLFSGAAAEPYDRAIEAIVDTMDGYEVSAMDWGKPLLHAYLAKARSSDAHAARADELIDRAIDTMERVRSRPSLYGGFTGVGWLCAHVDALFERSDDDAYDQVDQEVLRACQPDPTPLEYDLISGIVGRGVYFLERRPHPIAHEGMSLVVDALERHSRQFGDETTWLTPPTQLPQWQRERAPEGYYNLGVAHGVPGIIGILGEMRRFGFSSPRAEALLMGAARWVLSQKRPDGSYSSWIRPDDEPTTSRVAWCYGALGVSVALLLSARALEDAALEREALDIALGAAARRHGAGTVDAGLCHGAAGNAHLFNRLYQATGRLPFRDAAVFWFNCALRMRTEGTGVGGYRAWKPAFTAGTMTDPRWEDDAAFLTGASGVALAFLAATSAVEPAWDRVLLSSLEPAPVPVAAVPTFRQEDDQIRNM